MNKCRKKSNISSIPRLLKEEDMIFYKTEIIHDGPIFTTSDIHGDIHAFIISLRDCAKVISKDVYNKDQLDLDLEKNLNIDISVNDNGYDESLGYNWIGKNSYVVICGDMIDPKRSNDPTCIKMCNGKKCSCIYYPQLEIKLLRFINKMNELAKVSKGRIIKLLGNHEASNILTYISDTGVEINLLEQYIFDNDKNSNYYLNQNRLTIFNKGNIGYNLLFEDGCGILVKIKNTLFVHGKIPSNDSLITINKKNQIINNIKSKDSELISIYEYLTNSASLGLSPLWNRTWGFPQYYLSELNENELHDLVKNQIEKFLGDKVYEIENYRVVIGHCVQSNASNYFKINTTFTNISSFDEIIKTYDAKSDKIYNGSVDPTNQDTIFGITMCCSKPINNGLTDFYIYRVDVGSSREFDSELNTILSPDKLDYTLGKEAIYSENEYLFSKTPQILAINRVNDQDIITIIKSKMKNTRIHLPRPQYELFINRYNKQHGDKSPVKTLKLTDPHYSHIKYLKYKKKYLELKNIIEY
jgi:hypothetical protein